MLCKRCYCPLGIDSYNMIAFVRSILRSQGIYGVYPHSTGEPPAADSKDSGSNDSGSKDTGSNETEPNDTQE